MLCNIVYSEFSYHDFGENCWLVPYSPRIWRLIMWF